MDTPEALQSLETTGQGWLAHELALIEAFFAYLFHLAGKDADKQAAVLNAKAAALEVQPGNPTASPVAPTATVAATNSKAEEPAVAATSVAGKSDAEGA